MNAASEGPANAPRRRARLLLLLLHGTWATLGAAASAFLALVGGGHPPPIILLPLVALVWLAGHLALLVVGWLARRGAAGAAADELHPALSRPIIVAVVGAGAVALLGLIQLVVTVATGEAFPFRGALWGWTMAAWVLHGIGLAGLLLRRSWAAPMAALLSFGWAALMARQIVDHFGRGGGVDPLETLFAVGIIAATTGLGATLLRAPRSKVAR